MPRQEKPKPFNPEDFLIDEVRPEDAEAYELLKRGADNVIASFGLKRAEDNSKGENLLIVTDTGADPLMVKALHDAGIEAAGKDCRLMVAPETEYAAQSFGPAIGDKILNSDAVLFITSLSRSHSAESGEMLHPSHDVETIRGLLESKQLEGHFEHLGDKSAEEVTAMLAGRKLDPESVFPSKSRLISITNTNREILTTGGSQEDPVEMSKMIDRVAEVMEGVEKVRITSENGTNLELDIKVPSLMKDNGIIDKPGTAGNFPSGEYAGSVDLAGTTGTYVVDGAVGMIGRIDEPIIITIEDGVATNIEGGESAKRLKEILDKTAEEWPKGYPTELLKKNKVEISDDEIAGASAEELVARLEQEGVEYNKNYLRMSPFALAEFAIGMNSKAFRYDEAGEKMSPPTSLEGEKGLGTMHLALGRNSLFNMPVDDPDYNITPIHIDCVAMKPTIVGIREDGSEVELVKDGELTCL